MSQSPIPAVLTLTPIAATDAPPFPLQVNLAIRPGPGPGAVSNEVATIIQLSSGDRYAVAQIRVMVGPGDAGLPPTQSALIVTVKPVG